MEETKRRLRDAIKPDYFVTDAQVKKYGYDKGYLYPVYRSRARLFYDFGLTVYKLAKENSKTEIRNEKDFWMPVYIAEYPSKCGESLYVLRSDSYTWTRYY